MDSKKYTRVLCPSCNHKYMRIEGLNNSCPNCNTQYFLKVSKHDDSILDKIDYVHPIENNIVHDPVSESE